MKKKNNATGDNKLYINFDNVYLFVFTIYVAQMFIGQTQLGLGSPVDILNILQALRYFCYLFFIAKIIIDQFYKRLGNILPVVLMFSAGILFWLYTDNKTMLFTVLVLAAGCGCDWKQIMKICTCVLFVGLVTTLLLSAAGIFDDVVVLQGDRYRHSLGFIWVTFAPICYFFFCIGYTNSRNGLKPIEPVILWLAGYGLYLLTRTRYTFLLTTLYLAVLFIRSIPRRRRVRSAKPIALTNNYIICLLPFVIFISVLVIQSMYTPGVPKWDKLNNLISGRLRLNESSLDVLPITAFGQDIQWHGNYIENGIVTSSGAYNYVDCSYYKILFHYGIAGIIMTLLIYAAGIKKCVDSHNYRLLWGYAAVLLFCVTEPWIIELSFNMMPMIAAAGFWNGYRFEWKNAYITLPLR